MTLAMAAGSLLLKSPKKHLQIDKQRSGPRKPRAARRPLRPNLKQDHQQTWRRYEVGIAQQYALLSGKRALLSGKLAQAAAAGLYEHQSRDFTACLQRMQRCIHVELSMPGPSADNITQQSPYNIQEWLLYMSVDCGMQLHCVHYVTSASSPVPQ